MQSKTKQSSHQCVLRCGVFTYKVWVEGLHSSRCDSSGEDKQQRVSSAGTLPSRLGLIVHLALFFSLFPRLWELQVMGPAGMAVVFYVIFCFPIWRSLQGAALLLCSFCVPIRAQVPSGTELQTDLNNLYWASAAHALLARCGKGFDDEWNPCPPKKEGGRVGSVAIHLL